MRGLGIALFALGVVGAGVAVNGTRRSATPQTAETPVAAMRSDGVRIRFPADRLPHLVDAAGRERPIRSLLDVERPLRFGEYRWNDSNVPAGDTWVRVDLARQTLSVFRAGHEIGVAIILYGTDGKPTPTGTFPILAKAVQHRSSLYDAEMPYMLRLTGDGVAIHASAVRHGSATHGCIGVPEPFAARLFETTKRGDPVSILPPDAGPSQQHT